MATIEGISGVTGPREPKPAVDPPKRAPEQSETPEQSDTATFSPASTNVAFVQRAFVGRDSEIRQEQVDAAKARLAEGTYKLQATVLQVAARIAALVE